MLPPQLGIKLKKEPKLSETLCIFIKEFGINPLSEEYEVVPVYGEGDRIIKCNVTKKAMDNDVFFTLVQRLTELKKAEEQMLNKARRK